MDAIQEVVALVKKDSWFDQDDTSKEWVHFSTRDNGDVANEIAGKADIIEAKRLRALILSKFPSLNVRIEVIDEFVEITVDTYPKYYSANVIKERLKAMGYSTGSSCGGTTEAVVFEYKGTSFCLVSALGMPLTLCLTDNVFLPLNASKKVVVGEFDLLAETVKKIIEKSN